MNTEPQRMPNGEPVPSMVIGDNGKLRPIRPKERIFAMAWGCPDSPTFANGTQSMLIANPRLSPGTARVMATEYLTKPSVTGLITDILSKAGLGIEVRADRLKDIIRHSDIGKCQTKSRRDENGETITDTVHGPGYKDMLKAIDVANKMDGLYDKQRAAVDLAADEYRHLSKRFFQAPRRASPLPDLPVDSPVASVDGPPSDIPTSSTRKLAKRQPKAPALSTPQGDGGEGQTESRASVVSLVPTADENLAKGGI